MLMLLKKVSVLGNGNHDPVFWIMGPLSLINLPCTGVEKHEIVYVLCWIQFEPTIDLHTVKSQRHITQNHFKSICITDRKLNLPYFSR